MNNYYDGKNKYDMNYKEYINNYLIQVKKVRDIDFDDICFIANAICRNIVTSAIESSDMTVSGLYKNLTNINAEDIEIYDFEAHEFDIDCIMKYIPTGEYVLSVPYTLQMTISVRKKGEIDFLYGCSAFEVTIDNQNYLCDTDALYSLYQGEPEAFDYKIFCKL